MAKLPQMGAPYRSSRPGNVAAGTRGAWVTRHGKLRVEIWLVGLHLALWVLTPWGAWAQTDVEAPAAAVQMATRLGGAEQQLPLESERIEVQIDHGHATTKHRHVFRNDSGQTLEGQYSIDLGSVASATGFAYWNGEQKIVGEVFEREVAARIYEEVSGTGRDPGLLERSGEGVFSFRVSPIAPGERKRVEVSTSLWLRRRGNRLEYRVPLGTTAATGVVYIEQRSPIRAVTSTTHALEVQAQGPTARVRLGAALPGARELVLSVELDEAPLTPRTSLHLDAGHAAYVLFALPAPERTDAAHQGRDVTLVLDRSGSMAGEPLEAALRAAEALVRRLDDRDRVNVLAFDDQVSALYERPRPVRTQRAEALEFLTQVTDGGGTDLALALRESLRRQVKDERPDLVLFLTDGQSPAVEALQAARSAPAGVRLYTIGLGSGVDRPLLSRLAREHRGRFTYVAGPRHIEARLAELYSSIEQPILTDVELQAEGARVEAVYPRSLPDLFAGDELTLLLRVHPTAGSRTVTLRLTGLQDGERREFVQSLALEPQRRAWVGRLWAERRVDDLLESMALSGETEELRQEAIELALAYGIVTRYTSFLALPESEVTDAVRGTFAEERKRRAQILARRKDAAVLSRDVMPPGDPVLSVRAPRDARLVTAVFPFGLSLELSFVETRDLWQGRFLVPSGVADGTYSVDVFVVTADGTLETSRVNYTIDSRAPEVDVEFRAADGAMFLEVQGQEDLREVRVVVLDEEGRPSAAAHRNGKACATGGCPLARTQSNAFAGRVELPPNARRLRIVVTDAARNEAVHEVELAPLSVEGC